MKSPSLSTSMISTSLSSVLFTLLTFASGVVLARCLGEEGRGQYGAAYFWAQFLISLGSLSVFEAAIVRRDADVPAERYLSSLLVVAAALAIAAIGVFGLATAAGAVNVQGVSNATLILFVAACALISLLSRAMSTVENMRHNFKLLNFERLFSPFMFVLFSVAAAFLFGGTVISLMGAFLLSILPLFLLRLRRFRKAIFLPVNLDFSNAAVRLGARFHVAATLTLVATQLDRLILVYAWGPERLGHYFVALSIAGAGLSMVSQALGVTLLPMLSAVHPAVRRQRVERLFRYTIFATAMFVAGIWILAPVAIPIVYGAAFAPTILYAKCLSLALAPLPLRSIVLEVNRSVQKGRPGLEMAAASLVVFLVLFACTQFHRISDLFWAIGLSNVAAIVVGLRHPLAAGDMRLGSALVLTRTDFTYLASQFLSYARGMMATGSARR
jgi:O-antigen/teichoic acid export membrane protein